MASSNGTIYTLLIVFSCCVCMLTYNVISLRDELVRHSRDQKYERVQTSSASSQAPSLLQQLSSAVTGSSDNSDGHDWSWTNLYWFSWNNHDSDSDSAPEGGKLLGGVSDNAAAAAHSAGLALQQNRHGVLTTAKNGEQPLHWKNCEVIHIAAVVGNYSGVRAFSNMFKSVLVHRQQPLHLHLLTDTVSRPILQTLLYTWQLPYVNATFYDMNSPGTDDVRHIRTNHYSSIYTLVKLLYPRMLMDVDRIICLDTDLILLTDIGDLWRHFRMFNSTQYIGAVENLSPWYTRDESKVSAYYRRFPALGRGINTGVLLLDLDRMRQAGWDERWKFEVDYQMNVRGIIKAALGDQDVINSVVLRYPETLYRLACGWNVQLAESASSEECYENPDNLLHVIHWNRQLKFTGSKREQIFGPMYKQYHNLDGALLRHPLLHCTRLPGISSRTNIGPPPFMTRDGINNKYKYLENRADEDEQRLRESGSGNAPPRETGPCDDFLYDGKTIYRTHIMYFPLNISGIDSTGTEVTLVTQLNAERVYQLDRIFKRWGGPMSVALYIDDKDLPGLVEYFSSLKSLQGRSNIALHLVYRSGKYYPVNFLRNIALEHVYSRFVFLMDADFLPPHSLHFTLRQQIRYTFKDRLHKQALIVPAFETYRYKLSHTFPKNRSALHELVQTGDVFPFRFNEWPQGHKPTNFTRVFASDTPYTIQWDEDFEPYIVAAIDSLPRYDMRFVGFGWNKVSHILELWKRKFQFWVLPKTFIIHMPHSPSAELVMFREKDSYRDCLQRLKDDFVSDLDSALAPVEKQVRGSVEGELLDLFDKRRP